MAFGVTGTFQRARQALRGEKGQILGMRPRTAQEVLTLILGNAVRDKRTGCLLCSLRKDKKGYARVNFGGEIRVHRVIFYKGRPAKGAPQVLHTCDVRHCVEETHLYAGNNSQNIADKVSRDRLGKRLTIDHIRRIKTMLTQGIVYDEVVRLSGLARSVVDSIADGRRGRLIAPSADSVVEIPLEPVT